MIKFLTKCSFFLYGYFTINFAFVIADTHCFDLNYLDNNLFESFLYFLLSSNFSSWSCWRCFRLHHLHSFVFLNFLLFLIVFLFLSWYNVHGIMLVSWRFLFMLLFPFWSHSLSYLVRCSIGSWVTKQTAHNRMLII